METGHEKRKHARMFLPVVIHAPVLSEMPLVPEDISAGGFRVMINDGPVHGEAFECSIHLAGKVFDNCRAAVIWSYDNQNGTWYAGISIEGFPEAIEDFHAFLSQIHKAPI